MNPMGQRPVKAFGFRHAEHLRRPADFGQCMAAPLGERRLALGLRL